MHFKLNFDIQLSSFLLSIQLCPDMGLCGDMAQLLWASLPHRRIYLPGLFVPHSQGSERISQFFYERHSYHTLRNNVAKVLPTTWKQVNSEYTRCYKVWICKSWFQPWAGAEVGTSINVQRISLGFILFTYDNYVQLIDWWYVQLRVDCIIYALKKYFKSSVYHVESLNLRQVSWSIFISFPFSMPV